MSQLSFQFCCCCIFGFGRGRSIRGSAPQKRKCAQRYGDEPWFFGRRLGDVALGLELASFQSLAFRRRPYRAYVSVDVSIVECRGGWFSCATADREVAGGKPRGAWHHVWTVASLESPGENCILERREQSDEKTNARILRTWVSLFVGVRGSTLR